MRNAGPCRCFLLFVLTLPGIAPAPGAAGERKVVADFEDFGTWRLVESRGLKTQAWWPADVCLAGSDADKRRGDLVGEMAFAFDPEPPGPFFAGFERAKMSRVGGTLDGLEWEANAHGLPVSLRFQIQDAANRIFTTIPVPLTGEGWRSYRLEIDASTLPGFAECQFPARLKRVTVEAASACEGRIFLDDLALTGSFAKSEQLAITSIYEKISYRPEEEIVLSYRLRSASPEVEGTLRLEMRDFEGRTMLARATPFRIEATGECEVSFPVGSLPRGAYEVGLTATSGGSAWQAQDHFVVMVPNAGRPNRRPMWFGIADQTSWQGALENRRHWEWMRLLGIDLNRLELFADQFEPREGLVNAEGWADLIRGHRDAGVDVLVLYSTTPRWTHSRWQWRRPPDLWDKFDGHARRLAEFLKGFPSVRYLEFWNEPDISFFDGSLDDYLAMFRPFSKAVRETLPGVAISTGGVTVRHPQEKPGFSKGMFQEGEALYDLAAYHAHGPLINAEDRHAQVEAWLREKGLDGKRLINTESGDRSLETAEGRRKQAVTLFKKIVFSKSQPRCEAYFWFTLQDYWDFDPQADDSFGLVTSDNRAKASFAAFNTLIRELANTEPAPASDRVDGVALHGFQREDGTRVYAGWPVETRNTATLWIRTPGKLAWSDIFGNVTELEPLGGLVPVAVGSLPFYLSPVQPGDSLQVCAPGEGFLKVAPEIFPTKAGETREISVRFRNPTDGPLSGALELRAGDEQILARKEFQLDAGGRMAWAPAFTPAALPEAGNLRVEFSSGNRNFAFPITLIESQRIRKVARLGANPAAWPTLANTPVMTLDRPDQVFGLAYDPHTPAWQGASDLSATARMVHDGAGIRFRISVTDDRVGAVQPEDRLWQGDSVQIAFCAADRRVMTVLDLGLGEEGPAVWCSEHEDPARLGRWIVPITMTKTGSALTYDVYLPFERLGISAAERDLRFSFLVNEDDGRGRVRWIEWTPGIARDRSVEFLAHAQLE